LTTNEKVARALLLCSARGERMGWQVMRWLKQQVVQDVPAELAVCEFDCRKVQCTRDEWATCERRINRAAGELFPSHSVLFDARADQRGGF
jgi:hypothetical protein